MNLTRFQDQTKEDSNNHRTTYKPTDNGETFNRDPYIGIKEIPWN